MEKIMNMPMKKLIKMGTASLKADNEIEAVGFTLDNLLRRKGWECTCSVPGSLWLWQKTLKDGRTLVVNKNTAISIQSWLDEYGD